MADEPTPPLLALAPRAPTASAGLRHLAVLRFGRSPRGRTILVAFAVVLEAALLVTAAAHADQGHFRGVPGVSSVIVACALAALSGPVVGAAVALAAGVAFIVAVAEGVFGSWLVLLLWPGVAAVTGLITDQLINVEREREELVVRVIDAERRQLAAQIVGGIGHHFNNQLTVMMGYAELARLRLDEDEDHETIVALDALRAAGARLSAITNSLFVLTGGRTDAVATIDASTAARAAVATLTEVIAPRPLELRATNAPCPVLIERGSLELMLVELARNAAEASPPDAAVCVATERTASQVVLEVADAGRGMSPMEMRRAFEPFYSTKPPAASTGLGLPVVRTVAERAGGRIEIVPRPGGGIVVRIRLPLAA